RYPSAARLDDFLDDRAADSGTLDFIPRRERLEDPTNPLVTLRGDAGAIVLHGEPERIAEVAAAERDAGLVPVRAGVFDRVGDQIQEHLLQRDPLRIEHGHVFRYADRHSRRRSEQLDAFADAGSRGDTLRLAGRSAGTR